MMSGAPEDPASLVRGSLFFPSRFLMTYIPECDPYEKQSILKGLDDGQEKKANKIPRHTCQVFIQGFVPTAISTKK